LEVGTPVFMESPLKYHPSYFSVLTMVPYRDLGHCLVGSLTGAVASQRVTEAREGSLRLIGNQPQSAKA
jgi:hypothetical protein